MIISSWTEIHLKNSTEGKNNKPNREEISNLNACLKCMGHRIELMQIIQLFLGNIQRQVLR